MLRNRCIAGARGKVALDPVATNLVGRGERSDAKQAEPP